MTTKKLQSTFLIFLGGNYYSPMIVDQYLIVALSLYFPVVCFEFPRFLNLIDLITRKKNLINKVSKNLIIFHSFGIFPFGRSIKLINYINHIINYLIFRITYKISNNIKIITFTPEILFILLKFRELKNADVSYYIAENYINLPVWRNPLQKYQFLSLEKKLLKYSNRIIVNSKPLYQRYKNIHKVVKLFLQPANSLNLNIERSDKKKLTIPQDISRLPQPIVGFVGSFFEDKIDLKLVYTLLNHFPNISFVSIGLIKLSNKWNTTIFQMKNFYYLGFKKSKDIPSYIKLFDACLIPYNLKSSFYSYPTKIYDYLILGKPVITTALESIKYLADQNLIYWSCNNKDFILNTYKALNEKNNAGIIKKRIEISKLNSWNHRIIELINILTQY